MKNHISDHFIKSRWCSMDSGRAARLRRYIIVVTYAWLFMNVNPSYPSKALASMMLSRMINQSVLRNYRTGPTGGMSTPEAIALIQAINSGRNSHQSDYILTQDLIPQRKGLPSRMQGPLNRQLPVPVPVPIPAPIPAPIPLPVPVPVAVIAAIVAAFIAATFSGFPPFFAIVSSVFAAAIAIIIAFLSIFITVPKQKSDKKSPLIKKLVIKKTVLPFVIPIPLKSKEKKIIYKPVSAHQHHEKELEIPHQHIEYIHKHKKKKKKYETHKIDHQPVEVAPEEAPVSSLKKIESLIVEQDHIQKLIDGLIEKENRALGIKPVPLSKVKSKNN